MGKLARLSDPFHAAVIQIIKKAGAFLHTPYMTDHKPQITVVIPVHNRAGIVGKTLESVGCQTLRPLSVVLVDNNSSDKTLSVLQQWKTDTEAPDMQITITSENTAGATSARNRGLELVSTPYVMFFDSDDTMAPRHVERAMKAFNANPSADIVGWDIGINTLEGKRIVKHFHTSDPIWHCIMHGSMATQRYAMRTDLARRAGRWNVGIAGWNDIEFGIRILRQNPTMVKITDGVTVETFRYTESITGTGFSATPAKWETALDEIECNLDNLRCRRYVRLRRAILAGDYAREGAPREASRLMARVIADEKCPFYRLIYRFSHFYNSHGGRGTATLLRRLF